MSWTIRDLENAINETRQFYLELLRAAISSPLGGIILLDLILREQPGELGRVLSSIGQSTGRTLLSAYASLKGLGGGRGERNTQFGTAILIYPAHDETDAARIVEAARNAGAVIVSAHFVVVKEVARS
ncbi:MAG: hypothetical protein ACP5NY_01200 [Thermocladium sp.]